MQIGHAAAPGYLINREKISNSPGTTVLFCQDIATALAFDNLLADIILSISTNYWVVLLFNLLLLFLGLFMETIAIVLIITPIFMPITAQLGMDLTHMGVVMVLDLAVGASTPPLGVSLIAACRVAETPYETSFRHVFPFVGAMVFALIIINVFPRVATILPDLLMGKAQ